MLHEAVTKNQLGDVETVLQEERSKRMALCKDSAGVPLLHKAVYYDHQDIVKWLVENYPLTVTTKDRVSALHKELETFLVVNTNTSTYTREYSIILSFLIYLYLSSDVFGCKNVNEVLGITSLLTAF
jgi:hypothetical protein